MSDIMDHFLVTEPYATDGRAKVRHIYHGWADILSVILPPSAERTVALRKLLESMDAALRGAAAS